MTQDPRSSVDRALDIVEILARAHAPIRLSVVAREANLHRATAHRLLSGLVKRGWVARVDVRYLIGAGLPRLSSEDVNRTLASVAAPLLEELAESSRLMVNLQVLEFPGARVLRAERPSRLAALNDLVGILLPTHGFAGPIALLSVLSPKDRAPYLEQAQPSSHPDPLLEEIETAGRSGFAVKFGSGDLILASISRAISPGRGWPNCAITVVAPMAEATEAGGVGSLMGPLKAATTELETRLIRLSSREPSEPVAQDTMPADSP